MSNIIDAYCVYCCAQEVKKHTEETKKMTSKKAYINRKRYYLLQTPKNTRFPNLNPKTVIFWFTVFYRANSLGLYKSTFFHSMYIVQSADLE